MGKLDYELLKTENPFDYFMTKKRFSQGFWTFLGFFLIGTPAIGIINCLMECWVSLWILIYGSFALAVVTYMILYVYKAKNRDRAIKLLVFFGKCVEINILLEEDASEEQRSFLLCLEGVERGRGRLWLMD